MYKFTLLLIVIPIFIGCTNENQRNSTITKDASLQTQEQITDKTEEEKTFVEIISEEEHKKNMTIFKEIRNGSFSRGRYLTEITPEIARVLIVQDADVGLNRVKSISIETAKEYINHHSVYLSGLNSISIDVVRVLIETQSEEDMDGDFQWELNGLKTINVELARELAKVKAYLHLNGLINISKEVAHELAQHYGFPLYLNGLKSISVNVARELALHDQLYLDGMETISVKVAREFAKRKTHLHFDGLKTLSVDVAYELVGYNVIDISLNSLPTVSVEVARVFAKFCGRISLCRLTHISEEAAQELAKCKHSIQVYSHEVIRILQKYRK